MVRLARSIGSLTVSAIGLPAVALAGLAPATDAATLEAAPDPEPEVDPLGSEHGTSVALGPVVEGVEPPGESSDRAAIERLELDNAELRARLDRIEAAMAQAPAPSSPPPELPAVAPEPALQPTILGELDYRVYPSEAEGNTGFALGRFRPGLALSPVPWFRAVGTLEFAGEQPIVLDAFMRLRASPWAELTVGYSKPPLFASFVYEPVHTMPFPDRSPVVTAFRVRRDLGADVHLTPAKVPLEGWLRVGNGTGSALGNDNPLPAGSAMLDLVLGRARTAVPSERQRFGLRLGAGGLIEGARDRDGLVGSTPLGFVHYRPVVVAGLRTLGEAHAIAYAGPVRVVVEGAVAREARSRDDDGNPSTPRMELPSTRSYGLTSEVAWVVHGRARAVGMAPRGERGEGGAWRGGAVELAARYDGLWLNRRVSDVRPGGSHGGALALKWWPVDFVAATLAGYATRYDDPPIEEPGRSWSWGIVARASFFWGLPG